MGVRILESCSGRCLEFSDAGNPLGGEPLWVDGSSERIKPRVCCRADSAEWVRGGQSCYPLATEQLARPLPQRFFTRKTVLTGRPGPGAPGLDAGCKQGCIRVTLGCRHFYPLNHLANPSFLHSRAMSKWAFLPQLTIKRIPAQTCLIH